MKKLMTKLLSILWIMSMLFQGPVVEARALDYHGHWAENAIQEMLAKKVVSGFDDGNFKPDSLIKRGEGARILTNLLGVTLLPIEVGFSDVEKKDWYSSYINNAFDSQLINGFNQKSFGPEEVLTREQAASLLMRAFGFQSLNDSNESAFVDDETITSYAKDSVFFLTSKGYLKGFSDGTFRPHQGVTRGEFVTIISNIVSEIIDTPRTVENQKYDNLIITAAPVVLKNVEITGVLLLGENIKDGDITFENCTINQVTSARRANAVSKVIVKGKTTIKKWLLGASLTIENQMESGTDTIGKIFISERTRKNARFKLIGNFSEIQCDASDVAIDLEGKINELFNNRGSITLNGESLEVGLIAYDSATPLGLKPIEPNKGLGDTTTPSKPKNKTWTLTWNDEFNGTTIDPTKWTYDIGNWIVDGDGNGVARGWGNEELEYYTNSNKNAYLEDGNLVIKAIKEVTTDELGTYDYTSAKLKTKGLFSQKFGKFEIKAKLPVGKGFWPAFWLLPEDDIYGGWAASGEIDILEAWGSKPTTMSGALHYGGLWPKNTHTGDNYPIPNNGRLDEFHVYALEWEPGEIRWYVDGKLCSTQNNWYTKDQNGEKFAYPAPFDQEFYLIMNLAVGGWFDGAPDAATQFPSAMTVDYVRVYEKNNGHYSEATLPKIIPEPLPVDAKVPTVDGNLLSNGNFVEPIQNNFDGTLSFQDKWNFLVGFNGAGSQTIDTIGDKNYAKATITAGGDQNYSVQLIQQTTLGKGRYYKVSFDAKSSTNRNIAMKLGSGASLGYKVYSEQYEFPLTDTLKHYEVIFQMIEETDINARLEFNLGQNTNPVWIGNVRVEEVEGLTVDYTASKAELPDGNLIYNGKFDKETLDRMAYWNFVTVNGAAKGSVSESAREFSAIISNGGNNRENVTLDQKGIILNKGYSYKLTFDGRSDLNRDITVSMTNKEGTVTYLSDTTIPLETTTNEYIIEFAMEDESDPTSQLVFKLGGNNGDVFIDNVALVATTIDYTGVDCYPLKNGDFAKGLASWGQYIHFDANATIADDNGSAKISIANPGNETYSVLFSQGGFNFTKNMEYIVAFDVKSTQERNMEVLLDNATYYRYFSETVKTSTGGFTHYEFTFKMPKDDTVNLKFLMGKTDANVPVTPHDILIDNVVCQVKGAPPKEEEPNNGPMVTNGTFDTDTAGWGTYKIDGSNGEFSVKEGQLNVLFPNYAGWDKWSTQLYQENIKLVQGKTYTLTFDAKANGARNIWVEMNGMTQKTTGLTTDNQTFTYEFTATADTGKLIFLLGTENMQGADFPVGQTITIDNVVILEKK